jgi:hypothetical protein
VTIKREDIKKLVIQQMLQESIQEEGVQSWLSNALIGGGKVAQRAGEKIAPEDPNFLNDLSLVADFIEMYRDKVKNTEFYKKFFQPINEQYESQYLKQLKAKKATLQDLNSFVDELQKMDDPAIKRDLGELSKSFKAISKTTDIPRTATDSTSSAISTQAAKNDPAKSTTTSSTVTSPETIAPAPNPNDVEVRGTTVTMPAANIQVKKPRTPRTRNPQAKVAAEETAEETAKEIADMMKKQIARTLSSKDQTKLIQLLMKNPQQAEKAASGGAKPTTRKTKVKEAIVEEIYNLLTGETK